MPAYKYTLKSGKTKWYSNFYYKDWLGQTQHKCKRGFDTKGAAKTYESNFLAKYAKDPTILFSALTENYFEDISKRHKITTVENKRAIFDSKLLPFFGDMQICDIDAMVVTKWHNMLLDYRDENNEGYADTYLKSIHNQLSAIMNYAVKFYQLRLNPCNITGSIGKSKADEMSIWTKDQFEHFITFEKKTAYRVAFNTLFYSGLREGELLALTPKSIPRNRAVIIVNSNFAVVNTVQYMLDPKSDTSNRIVTIPKSLHLELLEYIDGMNLDPDERIFYFQKSGLWSEFDKIRELSGLPSITVHELRHSHVSMLIEMKKDIVEISKRIGHKSVTVTWNTYSHLYPGKAEALANDLEDLRSGKHDEEDQIEFFNTEIAPFFEKLGCKTLELELMSTSNTLNTFLNKLGFSTAESGKMKYEIKDKSHF